MDDLDSALALLTGALSGLTDLQELDLRWNDALTQQQVDALRTQLPGCAITF